MAYNNVTICLNGHIVSKNKAHSQNHCSKCGNKTYSSCTECNAPIRGPIKIEDVCILGEIPYTIPNYCYECGAPYPWTQKILDNAVELVSLDDDLDETSKELIISAIPELLVDTPRRIKSRT